MIPKLNLWPVKQFYENYPLTIIFITIFRKVPYVHRCKLAPSEKILKGDVPRIFDENFTLLRRGKHDMLKKFCEAQEMF